MKYVLNGNDIATMIGKYVSAEYPYLRKYDGKKVEITLEAKNNAVTATLDYGEIEE